MNEGGPYPDFTGAIVLSSIILGVLVTIALIIIGRRLYKPLQENPKRFLSSVILQTLSIFPLVVLFYYWKSVLGGEYYSVEELPGVISNALGMIMVVVLSISIPIFLIWGLFSIWKSKRRSTSNKDSR